MCVKIPELYRDDSADLSIVQAMSVGIIGYGNQGRAQAKNLRDSGCRVILGLRLGGPSARTAEADGFNVVSIPDLVKSCDILCFLHPDQEMPDVYKSSIRSSLRPGQTLLFAHGYNVFYGHLEIPETNDVILVAPAGAGRLVRSEYQAGKGIPTLLAVHQDFSGNAMQTALSYARAIGGTRMGAFLSTFREETESDLFGEQAVLTGGIPQLIRAAYETLVTRGFQPIVAWFVCYYEVKMIVDLFHDKGFDYFSRAISDTAEYGGYTRGKRIIGESVREELNKVLDEIQSGQFDTEWQKEKLSGLKILMDIRAAESQGEVSKFTDEILGILHNKNDISS